MANIYGDTSSANGQYVIVPENVVTFVIVNLGVNGLGVSFEDITVETNIVGTGTTTRTFVIPSTVRVFSPPAQPTPLLNSSEIKITPGVNSKVFINWTA